MSLSGEVSLLTLLGVHLQLFPLLLSRVLLPLLLFWMGIEKEWKLQS